MRPSRFLASVGFLLAVPLAVLVAVSGYDAGLYPYAAAPFVLAAALVAVSGGLFVVLPRLRRLESRWGG